MNHHTLLGHPFWLTYPYRISSWNTMCCVIFNRLFYWRHYRIILSQEWHLHCYGIFGRTQGSIKEIPTDIPYCGERINTWKFFLLHSTHLKILSKLCYYNYLNFNECFYLFSFLVSPFETGIVEHQPSPQVKRGLIQVSKILQNIANHVEFREQHMLLFNDFLRHNFDSGRRSVCLKCLLIVGNEFVLIWMCFLWHV